MRGPNTTSTMPAISEVIETAGGDLGGFFFVHRSFDGTNFRYFFLFVIAEIGVDQSDRSES